MKFQINFQFNGGTTKDQQKMIDAAMKKISDMVASGHKEGELRCEVKDGKKIAMKQISGSWSLTIVD